MTIKEIKLYEKLHAQLEGLYNEVANLSKKSPDDAVNKFKLKFINGLLKEINKFLKDESKPFNDFISFEENEVPTNSDVVLILAQYLSCLEKLRADNISFRYGNWHWDVSDSSDKKIRTAPPKKIQEK